MPAFRLRVLTGPLAGHSMPLEREVAIGRQGADLEIPDPDLSRRHARVLPAADGVVVEDLGSTNGTFIGGARIGGRVTLAAQETFVLGDTEIRVEAVPEPAPAAPRAPAGVGAAPEQRGEVRRAPRWWPLALAIPLLVLALAVALGAGGDEAQERRVAQSAQTSALSSEPTRTIFAGLLSGSPTGLGTVSIDVTRARSLRGAGGEAIPLSGKIVARFDNGSMTGTIRGTVTPQPDSSLRYAGTGRITSGTADFEGAKGTFRLQGSQAGGSPRADFTLRGNVTY